MWFEMQIIIGILPTYTAHFLVYSHEKVLCQVPVLFGQWYTGSQSPSSSFHPKQTYMATQMHTLA